VTRSSGHVSGGFLPAAIHIETKLLHVAAFERAPRATGRRKKTNPGRVLREDRFLRRDSGPAFW